MPRINSLDPTRRRLERISDFIRRELRARKIQQADMAAGLLGEVKQGDVLGGTADKDFRQTTNRLKNDRRIDSWIGERQSSRFCLPHH